MSQRRSQRHRIDARISVQFRANHVSSHFCRAAYLAVVKPKLPSLS